MVWTTIPDGDIDPESPIDTPLMAALRDNPIAIATGLSGAPKIIQAALDTGSVGSAQLIDGSVDTAELASGAVKQGNLNTGTQVLSLSATYNVTNAANVVSTGGEYVLSVSQYTDSATYGEVTSYIGGQVVRSTAYTAYLYLKFKNNGGGGTLYGYAQFRYIAASPPYDLGDGEVPLFAYALIDNATGAPYATCISQDPPWMANGPTRARPEFYDKEGKGYLRRRVVPVSLPTKAQANLDAVAAAERFVALSTADWEVVEVDQALKNADMNLIPHPFVGYDPTLYTPVLLDPVGSIMPVALDAHTGAPADEDDFSALLTRGFITIGNTPLVRSGPAGLMIVSADWKLTRK